MNDGKGTKHQPLRQITLDHCPATVQFGALKWLKLAEVMPRDAGLVLVDMGHSAASRGSDEEGCAFPSSKHASWGAPFILPAHPSVHSAPGLTHKCSAHLFS